MKKLIIVLCFVAFLGCASAQVTTQNPYMEEQTQEPTSEDIFGSFSDVIESVVTILWLWP